MTTYEQTAKTLKHISDDLDDTSGTYLDAMLRDFAHTFDKGLDAAAAEVARHGHYLEKDTTIDKFIIIPGGALTSHATTNAVIALKWDDGAAGAETTIATATTSVADTGDWAVGVAIEVTLTAPVAVAAGNYLILDITKGSTGVIVPASSFYVGGFLT